MIQEFVLEGFKCFGIVHVLTCINMLINFCVVLHAYFNITQTYSDFHSCKNDNFQMKNCDIFLIFAQNINHGYTLVPPHLVGFNECPPSIFRAKIRK